MTYNLSDKERDGVLSAPPERRYDYFVNKVTDWKEVWSLADGDAWASVVGDDKRRMPVWPHPGFAEPCHDGPWAKYELKAIEIHEFLKQLKAMNDEGVGVAVLYDENGDYLDAELEPFIADLRETLEALE